MPLTTASIGDADGWTQFFQSFERIVLVANSDAVRVDRLRQDFGDDALFVFFNKVYKVLSQPFDGASLLVARSSPAGANIVYRNEVESVLSLLRAPRFRGVMNLRAGPSERFSRAEEFGGAPAGFLDLSDRYDGFYPPTHLPTSGFALLIWLVECCPSCRVALAGFSGRRSARWKLFHDHDWTFEQIVQRLLVDAGRIELAEAAPSSPLAAISRRFPEFSTSDIASTAAEVLSERLEGANAAIDQLHSLTRPQARLALLYRNLLKPKTRKQRLTERRRAGEEAAGQTSQGVPGGRDRAE